MNASPQHTAAKPLAGRRVLVPRGGPWGDSVAASLRRRGAVPVIAPLINFAPSNDPATLEQALDDLQSGRFDWLTLTSATTVDVLYSYRATIPERTKVAAVGETTAAALTAVGYRVDLVPDRDNSAAGLAEQMLALEPEPRDILTLRSEIAKPVLTRMLAEAGHRVRSVVAYRTVGVPVTDRIAEDVRNGRINAILVTSGSVADQVQAQFPEIPAGHVDRGDRSAHREGRPARGSHRRHRGRQADGGRAAGRCREVPAAPASGPVRALIFGFRQRDRCGPVSKRTPWRRSAAGRLVAW